MLRFLFFFSFDSTFIQPSNQSRVLHLALSHVAAIKDVVFITCDINQKPINVDSLSQFYRSANVSIPLSCSLTLPFEERGGNITLINNL